MEDLLNYFLNRYLPRKEIVYRLPVSVNIADFWPKELAYREEKAVRLPLHSRDGHDYWYYPSNDILSCGDMLAAVARMDEPDRIPVYAHEDALIDEAFYSSVIEGANSTKIRAHELIRSGESPRDKDERMVLNNYRALRFVLDHPDVPVSHEIILEIGRLLTEGTMDEGIQAGYRDGPVQVISGRQEVVYEAPEAQYVLPMMDELIAYINDPEIHPVIKACIAHIYFVTVHPFFDGNGRTARALSVMILLRAGYDFFRQVPVSGLLAEERSEYYKAIRMSQDPRNGYDFTYFLQYYISMLSRTVETMHRRTAGLRKLERVREEIPEGKTRERLLAGAEWLIIGKVPVITAEKWKVKYKVSFETARHDLNTLADLGILELRIVGRKYFYDIV